MTNIELISKLLLCKSKKDITRLLNKHRVPISKCKYY